MTIVSGVLIPVVTLSFPQAMMRMYFDQSADGSGRRDLVSSVGLTTLAGMLLVVLGGLIAWLVGAGQGLTALFLASVVSARVAVGYFNYLTVTRNDYGLFFFNRLVESGVYLGAVALAVHWSKGGSSALLGGGDRLVWLTLCLASTLWTVALVSATYYAKHGLVSLKAKLYSRAQYRALLAYSLPLIPTFFLFEEAGLATRVRRIATAELERAAPRPAYSVLRSERAGAPQLPHWREGLRACLLEMDG